MDKEKNLRVERVEKVTTEEPKAMSFRSAVGQEMQELLNKPGKLNLGEQRRLRALQSLSSAC
ncbi:hypothetical protein KKB40_02150 [Patescibacteria group bacterium]|nr:hypothetical protein [Patescibacteria group bacterium]